MGTREFIAKNAAQLLNDGDIVNLGLGIPGLVPNYIAPGKHIYFHNENGSIGLAGIATPGDANYDPELIDACANCSYFQPGGVIMDSAASFAFVRSGRLDVTVLGAMEVDEAGSLANWAIPGKMIAGMGGAMDLVSGAKKVIIAMEHCSKNGRPKIVKECTLPLTALHVCKNIVTELAIINVQPNGLVLAAVAPGVSVEEAVAKTQAHLIIPPHIDTMVA